jgi:hypothetical protein
MTSRRPFQPPNRRRKTTDEPQAEGIQSDEIEISSTPGEIEFRPSNVSTNSPAVSNPPPAPLSVTPQTLLQYFNRSTNAQTFISVPVEFTPPGAPLNRGSSATYISR